MGRIVDQWSDVPSIDFFHDFLQNSLRKSFQFIFLNFSKCQTLGRRVFCPIGPANQRTSILYCRLTDFWWWKYPLIRSCHQVRWLGTGNTFLQAEVFCIVTCNIPIEWESPHTATRDKCDLCREPSYPPKTPFKIHTIKQLPMANHPLCTLVTRGDISYETILEF